MNARTMILSVITMTLFATLLINQPAAVVSADERDPARGLTERVVALEKSVHMMESSRQLDFLKTRVTDLERQARDRRQTSTATTSRSPANEISQLRRENSDLKRAIKTLEGKVSTGRQSDLLLERAIDGLRQKVSNLQSEVNRLRR